MRLLHIPFLILHGIFFSAVAGAANPTVPGSLESYSTIYSIGMEWTIIGDDDHDASCTVRYRILGNATYTNSKSLYRVDFQGFNTLAGSILFLRPGTNYEVELVLTDPDGGGITRLDTVLTKSIPVMPTGGNTYHVVPGTGGGDGSAGNPFQGVETAEAVVQPGDICLLHAGNYGGIVHFNTAGLANNHVVWKGAGDGEAVFQGIRVEVDYLWFEGLKIVDQEHGMRPSPPGPVNVVVKRCDFQNNFRAIYLNNGGECWYIVDNTIVGTNNPDSSQFGGEGVDLWHTSGHTVAYNTISRVADGISYPHKNVDMFGNDIFDTSDDGIEFDYGLANNRAWRNRITNPINYGISFQPQDGAPAYILYNQISVRGTQGVLKLVDRTDRALIAHNTFIHNSGPMAWGSQFLNNFEIKNNLWISILDRYAWENNQPTTTNWKTDFDYDGFDWGNFQYAFKWNDVRLDSIVDFYNLTGQEEHGILIDHQTCLDSLDYTELPSLPGEVHYFIRQYNTINPACNAVDAGIVLTGINEDYSGSAPDLGAYEIGKALPHYGVRSSCESTETLTWIGPTTANWYGSPTYWSANRFPASCDHVIIPPGMNVTLLAAESAQMLSLDVQGTATFVMEPTAEIVVQKQ
ncbi:MAG: right-handed parallel beta-helix repeat-containing protein [Saprospiraceae bacterium]|nr:right-handed parallel beta-helix repeat-containing protein [Saprospiraceae bacterium]